jgi:hypothetical protein
MTRPHLRPRRARSQAVVAALSLIVAACGSTTPTPAPSASTPPSSAPSVVAPSGAATPSQSADEIYNAIERQVVAIRGLKAVDVKRQTIDEAALRTLSLEDFDKDNPPDYVAANGRLYKALGLLPPDGDIRALYLDLIAASAQGFYRPAAKTLFIVSRSGAINGNDKFTFAHEYDHALQDASFTIFQNPAALLDQSDRAMARAGLYEGDATLLMTQWAIANLDPAGVQDIIAAADDPALAAIMAKTPKVIVDNLTFPYQSGLMFVQGRFASGSWAAVDKVYASPPLSTEQVLHPEKYDAGEAPVTVTIPARLAGDLGKGWKLALQDTFGEFQFGVWLREGGVEPTAAAAAAAGWGGDRLAVLDGPGGASAVVMKTAWDSPADAQAFETAASTALRKAGGTGGAFIGEGGTTRWIVIGSDAMVFERVANTLGLAG